MTLKQNKTIKTQIGIRVFGFRLFFKKLYKKHGKCYLFLFLCIAYIFRNKPINKQNGIDKLIVFCYHYYI